MDRPAWSGCYRSFMRPDPEPEQRLGLERHNRRAVLLCGGGHQFADNLLGERPACGPQHQCPDRCHFRDAHPGGHVPSYAAHLERRRDLELDPSDHGLGSIVGGLGASAARLINLSSRGPVTAANPLVDGFSQGLLTQDAAAAGGRTGPYDIRCHGNLGEPVLKLFDSSGRLILTNQGWDGSSASSKIFALTGAFPFPRAAPTARS